MTLSAFDSVQRGFVNARANWELIFIQWLQTLVVGLLCAAGLLPPLAVLGLTKLSFLSAATSNWPALLEQASGLIARSRESWLLLMVSIGVAAAIWLLAMVVYCYFQGAIYGVLTTGDRQAPQGVPRGAEWFRTFSWTDLRGWGSHFMWRFFWLFNLIALVAIAWLLLPTILVMIALWGGRNWGDSAGLAIGCAGAIPVGFSILVFGLWASVAQATLAGQDVDVWQAGRRGLQVLGRRLGAVLFIFLAVIFGSIFLSVAISLFSAVISVMLSQWDFVRIVGETSLALIQWAISSAFGIGLAAALIGLVRSETARGIA